jgi:hypothetical protein
MLKVGDKLICKVGDGWYTVGKAYEVTKVDDGWAFLTTDDGDKNIDFCISVIVPGMFYIWDTFYTLIELRKLKLEKLCLT